MFFLALEMAAVASVIYVIVGAVGDTREDEGFGPVLGVAIVGFLIALFVDWFWLWMLTPPMYFGVIWQFVFFHLLLFAVLTGIKNFLISNTESINVTLFVFGGLFVIWVVCGIVFAVGRPWGDQAYRLAKLANVHEQPVGVYPPTDTEHISLMPHDAASFKADQALTQAQGQYANLSTQYDVGVGTKQSIRDHLYWVFDLRITGWRNANRVNRIVPGYVVVDAENPEATPQLKLGYKMRYTPGSPTDTSLTRLIWTHYKGYAIDDPTIEVNDDWHPYYTATINKPAYSFGPSVPSRSIVIDPVTGKITDYAIKDTPSWVDRVYSSDTVKRLMNWWGAYGLGPNKTPRKFLGIGQADSNRYKVAGEPVLVYTKDGDDSHPEWQVLMTSYKSDTAATFVALFDGRSTNVRLYRVPNLQTDEAVLSAFRSTASNVKKYVPEEPALHKIYGRLTWVIAYLPDEDASGPRSLQAIGLVAADDAQGINVQMGDSKSDVLTKYQLWLANSQDSSSPNEDSVLDTKTGVVSQASTVVISGNTTFYILLEGDNQHVFRAQVSEKIPELPFVKPGARVTMTYQDLGNATVNVTDYDDLGLTLASK